MSNTNIELEETEKALKNFLLDIDCLNNVSPWINKFNIFHVLKIDNFEIRHSNMLAWLLDPNENHGLGDKVLLGLINYIVSLKENFLSTHDLCQLLHNSYSFSVFRENNHTDILLVSDENKIVICIENKIYSKQHGNQLKQYKEAIERRYHGYTQFYLYLTLPEDNAKIPIPWTFIFYDDMHTIIKTAYENSELAENVKNFIKNYLDVIEEKTQQHETEIKNECAKIYLKHKKALEFLCLNKNSLFLKYKKALNFIFDKTSLEYNLIYSKFNKWLSVNNNEVIDKNSLKGFDEKEGAFHIQFQSAYLNSKFKMSNEKKSYWETDYFYCYQLIKYKNDPFYQLCLKFCYKNCCDEDKQTINKFFEKMEKNVYHKGITAWYIVKEYKTVNIVQGDFTELMDTIETEEEEIKNILDKN